MIEVLHLIDTYRIGGPGKTVLNSARFVDAGRFRIHVGSFVPPDKALREFAGAAEALQLPYLAIPDARRAWLQPARRVREYVRRNRVDVVHTHGYRTDFIGYVATAGLPVARVTTHHGWIRNNGRQALVARLALGLCRRMDAVELVAESLRRELPQAFASSDRVEVVHNAIVLDDYLARGVREEVRRLLGVGDGDQLVGVVGRLSPEKGCVDMIEAFTQVAAGHERAVLAFVGEGPIEREMRQLAAARGLSRRVLFAGYRREVQAFYEAFDAIASPSRTEGLSNVILEAMAFRLPIVATRVGGNTEILENGISALVVEPANPGALASALSRVLSEPDLGRRLAEAARRQVETAFSFSQRMRKEEGLYVRALGRRHRRRPPRA